MQNPRQYKVPDWFLNRQKDIKDGRFSQVLSNNLDNKLRGASLVKRSRLGLSIRVEPETASGAGAGSAAVWSCFVLIWLVGRGRGPRAPEEDPRPPRYPSLLGVRVSPGLLPRGPPA